MSTPRQLSLFDEPTERRDSRPSVEPSAQERALTRRFGGVTLPFGDRLLERRRATGERRALHDQPTLRLPAARQVDMRGRE